MTTQKEPTKARYLALKVRRKRPKSHIKILQHSPLSGVPTMQDPRRSSSKPGRTRYVRSSSSLARSSCIVIPHLTATSQPPTAQQRTGSVASLFATRKLAQAPSASHRFSAFSHSRGWVRPAAVAGWLLALAA